MNWMSFILRPCEQALAAYIRSLSIAWLPNDQIYCGLSHGRQDDPNDEEKLILPCVKIICDSATQDPDDYHQAIPVVHARIEVIAAWHDYSGDDFSNMAGETFDKFADPEAPTELNTFQTDVVFESPFIVTEQAYNVTGNRYTATLKLDIPCLVNPETVESD